ncbi:hypothetical protein AAKU52_001920 [Pedobacter sp. CG_S7]|uniref:hypothetical protein n=1 Tax=Pedobacter sp. CG_S7 TaxID=3143930 RepID=UPI00339ACED2
MKCETTIKLKAVFLLFVFLLNTLVGFACATGLEGISGHKHHENEGEILAPNHSESMDHDSDHHHFAKEDKENCCKDEVAKLVMADKVFASGIGLNIQPLVSYTIVTSFYQFDVLGSLVYISKPKYFVRHHHPPIPDIRINIQSFQI